MPETPTSLSQGLLYNRLVSSLGNLSSLPKYSVSPGYQRKGLTRNTVVISREVDYENLALLRVLQGPPKSQDLMEFRSIGVIAIDKKKHLAQAAPSFAHFSSNHSLEVDPKAKPVADSLLQRTIRAGGVTIEKGLPHALAAFGIPSSVLVRSKGDERQRFALGCNLILEKVVRDMQGHGIAQQGKPVVPMEKQAERLFAFEKTKTPSIKVIQTMHSPAKVVLPTHPSRNSPDTLLKITSRAVIGSGAGERIGLQLKGGRRVNFEVHGLRRGEQSKDVLSGVLTGKVRNELHRTQKAFEKGYPKPAKGKQREPLPGHREGQKQKATAQAGKTSQKQQLKILSRRRIAGGEAFTVRLRSGRSITCKVTGLQGQKLQTVLKDVLSPALIRELNRTQREFEQRCGKLQKSTPKIQITQLNGQSWGFERGR